MMVLDAVKTSWMTALKTKLIRLTCALTSKEG